MPKDGTKPQEKSGKRGKPAKNAREPTKGQVGEDQLEQIAVGQGIQKRNLELFEKKIKRRP